MTGITEEETRLADEVADLRQQLSDLRVIADADAKTVVCLGAEIDASRKASARLSVENRALIAELDPPECRMQIGRDGYVPENARDGMRLWKREAGTLQKERNEAREELTASRDGSAWMTLRIDTVTAENYDLNDQLVTVTNAHDSYRFASETLREQLAAVTAERDEALKQIKQMEEAFNKVADRAIYFEDAEQALRAEVERLREALRDVAQFDAQVVNGYCWCLEADPDCVTPMCIHARAALADQPTPAVPDTRDAEIKRLRTLLYEAERMANGARADFLSPPDSIKSEVRYLDDFARRVRAALADQAPGEVIDWQPLCNAIALTASFTFRYHHADRCRQGHCEIVESAAKGKGLSISEYLLRSGYKP